MRSKRRPNGLDWPQFAAWAAAQYEPVPYNDCKLWALSKHYRTGYGQCHFQSRAFMAHRVAFAHAKGLSEPQLRAIEEVRHACDEKSCINPDHLQGGTHAENMAEAVQRGLSPYGEYNHNAKLTDGIVRRARRRWADGERSRDLAAEFGVAQSVMWRALAGRTWRHVRA